MKHLKIFGLSDAGRERRENQDAFWICNKRKFAAAVVADGLGQYQGSAQASRTAVDICSRQVRQYRDSASALETVYACFTQAHERIRRSIDSSDTDMDTTCTMCLIEPKYEKNMNVNPGLQVTAGHVGDSRLYHMRGRVIEQVTRDHTLLQRMLDEGVADAQEKAALQKQNMLCKTLGGAVQCKPDIIDRLCLYEGEMLILCTDGLYRYLSSDDMRLILRGTRNVRKAVRHMVELAKFRGGADNITVVAIEYGHCFRVPGISLN